MTAPDDPREVWFLTGSQHLYGPEVIDQVAANSADIVRVLDASSDVPVRVVAKPVLTESAAIRRALLDAESDDACVGVIAWMHTFSPGEDVDHRARRTCASRCCTCTPRPTRRCRGPRSTWTS